MRKLNIKPEAVAVGCIVLDAGAIALLLKLLFSTSNVGLMIVFIALIYGITVDSAKAILYLILRHKSKNK